MNERRTSGTARRGWAGVVLLGSALATLGLARSARAVTTMTIDGKKAPWVITAGDQGTVHVDVSKPGGIMDVVIALDAMGTGKYDTSDPVLNFFGGQTDGNPGDLDPAPGVLGLSLALFAGGSGPMIAHFHDHSDGSTLDVPFTGVPAPQPQSIHGTVSLISDASGTSSVHHANIYAAADNTNVVASVHTNPDGTYALPVPPGTYVVWAEWVGYLRSERQRVTVGMGSQVQSVNLALIHGHEVEGTVRTDAGTPAAGVAVTATSDSGQTWSTTTIADGTYVVVVPPGHYTVDASNESQSVSVTTAPLAGVDFPPAGPVPTSAPAGTIVSLAGQGRSGQSADGTPAQQALMGCPAIVTLDASGTPFIADICDMRVWKLDTFGRITSVAGTGDSNDTIDGFTNNSSAGYSGDGGPATQAQLNSSFGEVIGRDGSLYIADTSNNRVRKVSPDGTITTVTGNGTSGNSGDGGPATAAEVNPTGLAIDANDNLLIGTKGEIRKVTPQGIITTIAGGGSVSAQNGMSALAVKLGAVDLAVDAQGNIYTNANDARILKISPAGIVTVVAGTGTGGYSGDGGPATQGQFSFVQQMAVDSAGNLFLAELFNNRVRKIDTNGIISTIAGSGPSGSPNNDHFTGSGGPGTSAHLAFVTGVAVDPDGNLLIADQNANLLKLFGAAAPGLFDGRPFPKGDVNADGRVTVSDAVLALRMAVGSLSPTDAQRVAADTNGDGKVDITDVTNILRLALGL